MIASKKIPDHGALKSFAKRVSSEEYPELYAAIAEGGVIFGVKSPEAYIAFGDYSTGVRGYESNPPFILIGNEHLINGGPHQMTDVELRFLIGSELAHLKFKHNRITSADVWEGAFDKTISVMEFLPVVGGYLGKLGSLGKFATQANQFSSRFGSAQQYISHAWGLASRAQEIYRDKIGKKEPPKNRNEKKPEEAGIIGAFREMRLTADRAGLVLCKDLQSAVQAIFKSSQKFRTHLSTVEKTGLDVFLSKKDEERNLLYQNLAIRLAALFSFYLSEDFTSLLSSAYYKKT
jgi:hypothetical protein